MVGSGNKWGKVVVIMLMGEYHRNIDEKQRLAIPSKLKEELKEEVVVTRGLENCLFIYPVSSWEQITSKLKTLPFTKKDARAFTRIFLSGATVCDFDKQGRITLTPQHIAYANLKKECVLLGVNDRLELWDKATWEEFYTTKKEDLSDLADHLFDIDM